VYVTNNPVNLSDPTGDTRRPPYPLEHRQVRGAEIVDWLQRQYQVRVIDPTEWTERELRDVAEGVHDLATFMGGPARFQGEMQRGVWISRLAWQIRYAAVALPIVDVVFFESSALRSPSVLK
jgi:hypothetical protein